MEVLRKRGDVALRDWPVGMCLTVRPVDLRVFFSNLHDSERSYSNFLISRLSSKWTCMVCGIFTAGLLSVIGNPLRYAG